MGGCAHNSVTSSKLCTALDCTLYLPPNEGGCACITLPHLPNRNAPPKGTFRYLRHSLPSPCPLTLPSPPSRATAFSMTCDAILLAISLHDPLVASISPYPDRSFDDGVVDRIDVQRLLLQHLRLGVHGVDGRTGSVAPSGQTHGCHLISACTWCPWRNHVHDVASESSRTQESST